MWEWPIYPRPSKMNGTCMLPDATMNAPEAIHGCNSCLTKARSDLCVTAVFCCPWMWWSNLSCCCWACYRPSMVSSEIRAQKILTSAIASSDPCHKYVTQSTSIPPPIQCFSTETIYELYCHSSGNNQVLTNPCNQTQPLVEFFSLFCFSLSCSCLAMI